MLTIFVAGCWGACLTAEVVIAVVASVDTLWARLFWVEGWWRTAEKSGTWRCYRNLLISQCLTCWRLAWDDGLASSCNVYHR